MALRKCFVLTTLVVIIFLLLSSCDEFFLLQPYILDGKVSLYLDGKMIGTTDRLDTHKLFTNEGELALAETEVDNVLKALHYDELLVFNRGLEVDEIESLFDNPGTLPLNTDSLGAYYKLDGNLHCDPTATADSGIAISNISYEEGGVDGGQSLITALNSEDGRAVLFNSSMLVEGTEEITINVWIKSARINEAESFDILAGTLYVRVYNGAMIGGIIHDMSGYDPEKWHMLSLVIKG